MLIWVCWYILMDMFIVENLVIVGVIKNNHRKGDFKMKNKINEVFARVMEQEKIALPEELKEKYQTMQKAIIEYCECLEAVYFAAGYEIGLNDGMSSHDAS